MLTQCAPLTHEHLPLVPLQAGVLQVHLGQRGDRPVNVEVCLHRVQAAASREQQQLGLQHVSQQVLAGVVLFCLDRVVAWGRRQGQGEVRKRVSDGGWYLVAGWLSERVVAWDRRRGGDRGGAGFQGEGGRS